MNRLDIVSHSTGRVEQRIVPIEGQDFFRALLTISRLHFLQVIRENFKVTENTFLPSHKSVAARQADKTHVVKKIIGSAEGCYNFGLRHFCIFGG